MHARETEPARLLLPIGRERPRHHLLRSVQIEVPVALKFGPVKEQMLLAAAKAILIVRTQHEPARAVAAERGIRPTEQHAVCATEIHVLGSFDAIDVHRGVELVFDAGESDPRIAIRSIRRDRIRRHAAANRAELVFLIVVSGEPPPGAPLHLAVRESAAQRHPPQVLTELGKLVT
jgi:hypothetical protein